MSRHWVHHIDGEIVRCEFTNSPGDYPGAVRIEVADNANYRAATHKVIPDPEFGVVVVEKTADEKHQYQLPKLYEVRMAVAAALADSDKTQVSDFPVAATERVAWKNYRQSLRDLSKNYTDPLDQLRNWPVRPDGTDPIEGLRNRL